jgi:AcrR family transcriptional regulator
VQGRCGGRGAGRALLYALDMARVLTGRPGRPAAASREDALALGADRFLAGERVDVKAIAQELGLARATMHRWFGTRDAFIGVVLASLAEQRLDAIRRHTPGVGARALLDTFDRFNRELATTRGLRALLAQEQERALRILTSSGGIAQPRMVAAVERLIRAEIEAGAFAPAVAPESLAYAIVRLAEAFLYNDAIVGMRGDTERLREVLAALLGVSR